MTDPVTPSPDPWEVLERALSYPQAWLYPNAPPELKAEREAAYAALAALQEAAAKAPVFHRLLREYAGPCIFCGERLLDGTPRCQHVKILQAAIDAEVLVPLSPTEEPTKDERCPTCGLAGTWVSEPGVAHPSHSGVDCRDPWHTKDKTPETAYD